MFYLSQISSILIKYCINDCSFALKCAGLAIIYLTTYCSVLFCEYLLMLLFMWILGVELD